MVTSFAGPYGKISNSRTIPVILLSFLSDSRDILKGLAERRKQFHSQTLQPGLPHPVHKQRTFGRIRAEAEPFQAPVALEYAGKEYSIASNPRQILDILLATYETAVRKNEELIRAETELQLLNEDLERKVIKRTAALTAEIAERRRVEEELRKKSEKLIAYSAKLEQTNRDLQDFAFIASHDLQEPVRKIQTFVDRITDSV